jgi:hypothetical protein
MESDPQKRQNNFDKIARTLSIAAIFIMLFSLSAGAYVSALPTVEPTATETPIPSPTVSPTPTRTPPPTARLTPGPREVFIPGLDADALRNQFRANLFICSEAELTEAGLYQWTCTQGTESITVEMTVLSRTPDTVDQVTMVISQPNNPFLGSALRYFRMLAQMRYEGAEPRSAEDWLTNMLPRVASDDQFERAVFGEVLFVLNGTPRQWTFEMGELPESDGEE